MLRGGRAAWPGLHKEGCQKRMQAEQDKGEDQRRQHRARFDLEQPGNPAPNNTEDDHGLFSKTTSAATGPFGNRFYVLQPTKVWWTLGS